VCVCGGGGQLQLQRGIHLLEGNHGLVRGESGLGETLSPVDGETRASVLHPCASLHAFICAI